MAQAATVYYFVFFLVIMPLLGLIETPRKTPNSITEAVLEKNKGSGGAVAGTCGRRARTQGLTFPGIVRGVEMSRILGAIAAATFVLAAGVAFAQEEHHAAEPTHFPIMEPRHEDWTFAGPFGTYDKGQLQRGLKVYKDVCADCHSMHLVAFRTLAELGYSDAQVKAFAAEYTVQDGPNDDGEMFERPGIPSDYFPSPFANPQAGGGRERRCRAAGLLADRQGARRRARLPDIHFRHLHAVCRERAGLHLLTADRLRPRAARRHGDR